MLVPNIPVITGVLQEPYEILDSIFASAWVKSEGFIFQTIDTNKAFDGVKDKLREYCKILGGNAVINCQFEYNVGRADGIIANSKQNFELFAYGTAVISSKAYVSTIYELTFDKDKFITCPACEVKLKLDATELHTKYFECTDCKRGINFSII